MIHHGDLFDVLPTLAASSIAACITDPPYGIGFMGKAWDTFSPSAPRVPSRDTPIVSDNPNLHGRHRSPAVSDSQIAYDRSLDGQRGFQGWCERWAREVYRVLTPGGYLLVCGAPRSFHRMTCGIEDAGFEIRDVLTWLYGQGFPKSLDVQKATARTGDTDTAARWAGWGTALKPGWEPIVLARKPVRGTVAANVLAHGTGALNIDACRIPGDAVHTSRTIALGSSSGGIYGKADTPAVFDSHPAGRWPANVVFDDDAAALLDDQSGDVIGYDDGIGGASRFFYVAKPARGERDDGCDHLRRQTVGELTNRRDGSAGAAHARAGAGHGGGRNCHPTVKPVDLMRWLVRLVTPPDGIVLDPFTGSGTTGIACAYELRPFVGIEREAEYVTIATARIAAAVPLFAVDRDTSPPDVAPEPEQRELWEP